MQSSFFNNEEYTTVNPSSGYQPHMAGSSSSTIQPMGVMRDYQNEEQQCFNNTNHIINSNNTAAVCEEEEDVEGAALGQQQQLLHVSPFISKYHQHNNTDTIHGRPTDPVTAALLRRHQQRNAGLPTSPLSPRTLQQLVAATMNNNSADVLSQLTMEEVLAPVPLALCWYPTATGDGGDGNAHPDRKRASREGEEELAVDGVAHSSNHQNQNNHNHIDNMVAVGHPHDSDGNAPFPRMKRQRFEQQPLSLLGKEHFYYGGSYYNDGTADHNNNNNGDDDNSNIPSCALGETAAATMKRVRDEPVYEYVSRGRRFH